jgi:branched-chain amino acid transport system permease protein
LLAGTGVLGAAAFFVSRRLQFARTIATVPRRAHIPPSVLRSLLLLVLSALLLLAPLRLGIYWNQVLGSIGLFVLLGLGLNIVVGFAGLLDLGYVGFYAIGAYTIALLTAPGYPFEWGFWPALPMAMIVAAISGVLLGIPVLRLRGDYLAIVTLGFGEIIRIIFKFNPLSGGPQGILNVGLPHISLPFVGLSIPFESSTPFYYLILLACLIVAVVAARLNHSRTGRGWTAMREDEDAAEAMGIDTTRSKLLAFGAGAFFAGLAGAIYASRQHHIFPDDFTLLVSINALALIIIGGLGSIPGVIIGSVVLIGLPEVLRPVADYRLLFYAALLIVMMLVRPEGLIPSRRRQLEFHERDVERETVEST